MNKIFKKVFVLGLSAVFVAGLCACSQGEDDTSNLVKLTIEGGGQNGEYTSSASMTYDKNLNPYPYNTLETLVDEWNELNAQTYGYYFEVATSAINNDRETLVPMLQNGTAPEIVYYLPTTIAEDQNKGWFYDISDVMEQPNKYSKEGEAGSERWRDVYDDTLYYTSFAPNGEKYTVELEQNPIGIIYNKTLFEAAGITEIPETFKEFMEVQDAIYNYAVSVGRGDSSKDSTYITPFFQMYPWYDNYLESSLYGEDIEYFDVITVDGAVDAEEFARGYMTTDPDTGERMYSPDSDKQVELYRLIKLTTKYYPDNYSSYYAEQQFVVGNIAMLEATGSNIRSLIDTVDGDFEIGIMPYPVLTEQPENEEYSEYYTTYSVDNYVRRGISGYSTGWAITNSAMNKDAENGDSNCVDACIDMLMYLTCYENNDKLVNDLGFAIPLSGNTTVSYFAELYDIYEEDEKDENSIVWCAMCAGSSLNKDYYDAVYLFRTTAMQTDISDMKSKLASLKDSFVTAINTLYTTNLWDRSTWPEYGVSNKNIS